MNKKIVNKIIGICLITILMIIISTSTFAGVKPGDITGEKTDIDTSVFDKITDTASVIGTFVAVGVLMVIGIRYLMGSLEEKASYKKSMMPYIVGCFILFGASAIAPMIQDLFTDMGDTVEDIGGKILGIIQVIGTFISVGALMIMGIRYMMGSAEERASYKKSMIPYIVGAVILFGAVNITSMIYDMVPKESSKGQLTTTTTTQSEPPIFLN